MDYEKKYKEAIERARKWYNDSHITIGLKGNLKDIFPELAEPDDETLRKNLIKAFNTVGGRHWGGLEVREILTWLNKQDEIDLEHYKDGENEKRKFVGYGFLKCKGDFLSFKEGETYWLEYIGKDNYNVRSDNLLGQTFHIKPVELYTVFCPTTWLEKQGKKTQGKTALEAIKEEEVDNQNCVKPDDKVEIKFKIEKGKWYVCIKDLLDNYTNKAFFKGDTYLSTQDGSLMPSNSNIPFGVVCPDTYFREWTIKDAKDGDVLVDVYGNIGICEQCDDFDWVSYCSLGCNGGFQHFKIEHENEKTYPATKKQRDTLMKAMADAGYTFDFEKKELKKIEQKTVYITDEWIEDYWQHEVVERELERCKHEFETLGGEQEGNSDKTANELHESFVPVDEEEQPKKKHPKILSMFYALLMCLFYVALAIATNILSHKLFGWYCGIDSIAFFMVFSIIWVLCYIHISED